MQLNFFLAELRDVTRKKKRREYNKGTGCANSRRYLLELG
jgi:hypothetical protein